MAEKKRNKEFDRNLGFLEHLELLRWHLVRSLIVVLVFVIGLFMYIPELVRYVILWPLDVNFPTNQFLCNNTPALCLEHVPVKLQSIDPTEQFTRAILIAFVGGLILASPYIFWELWRFIRPGLYVKEIKQTRGAVFIVSSLFLTGVSFAYFIILPFTFHFFATFKLDPQIENIWRIGDIVALVVQFCLAGGILFEMPVLAYILSKLGILTPMLLKRFRKHSVVVILVVAGILTPSPDVLSQALLAVPMFILYQVSIWISARVYNARRKKAMEEGTF